MKSMKEKHHPYSPSKFSCWAVCPHWTGTDRETEEANEGTEAHALLAEILAGKAAATEDTPHPVAAAADYVVNASCGATLHIEERLESGSSELLYMYGTPEVWWRDDAGLHIFDYKHFSRCGASYGFFFPQLMAYAALTVGAEDSVPDEAVELIVYHGGSCEPEAMLSTIAECYNSTHSILAARQSAELDEFDCEAPTEGCAVHKYCKYCKHFGKCGASGLVVAPPFASPGTKKSVFVEAWRNMPLCQKVWLIDTIEEMGKKLKDELKEKLREAPDGRIEENGFCYELKRSRGGLQLPSAAGVAESLPVGQDALLGIAKVTKGDLVKLMRTLPEWEGMAKKDVEAVVDGIGVVGKDKETLVLVKGGEA